MGNGGAEAESGGITINTVFNFTDDVERPPKARSGKPKSTNTEFVFQTSEFQEGDYIKAGSYVYRINSIIINKHGRVAYAQALEFIRDPPNITEQPQYATESEISKRIGVGGDMVLGKCEFGSEALLESNLLYSHVFLTGKTGSGKTTTAFKMLTELHKTDSNVLIIDTHGEYAEVLERNNIPYRYLTDPMSFDDYMTEEAWETKYKWYQNIATNPETSQEDKEQAGSMCVKLWKQKQANERPDWIVYDVTALGIEEKRANVGELLTGMFNMRKTNTIKKFIIFLDEAHNYIPQGEKSDAKYPVMTIAAEGRKFGMGLVVISQRPARVEKSVISQCNTALIHRLTNQRDLNQTAANTPGMAKGVKEQLPYLKTGECFITTPDLQTPIKIKIDMV